MSQTQGPPPPPPPPPNYPPQGYQYQYQGYPPQGYYPRKKSKAWLIILIVLLIGGIGFLFLMAVIIMGAPAIFKHLDDMTCKNNLKQIHTALQTYQNKFGDKYPDKDGDLFLAMLYYTGQLTDKEVFLCPSDKTDSRNNAHWIEEGVNKTSFKFQYRGANPRMADDGSIWPDISDWDENTFEPWEISYAGRKNSWVWGKVNKFYLQNAPSEPVPIVSDDTEDQTGKVDRTPIHTDHINILMSDGRIEEKVMLVGMKVVKVTEHVEVEFDLEALSN